MDTHVKLVRQSDRYKPVRPAAVSFHRPLSTFTSVIISTRIMTTFHPFPRLPLELRQQIWTMATEPRLVLVGEEGTNYGFRFNQITLVETKDLPKAQAIPQTLPNVNVTFRTILVEESGVRRQLPWGFVARLGRISCNTTIQKPFRAIT